MKSAHETTDVAHHYGKQLVLVTCPLFILCKYLGCCHCFINYVSVLTTFYVNVTLKVSKDCVFENNGLTRLHAKMKQQENRRKCMVSFPF
jgi:hypothetical protein